MKYKLLVLDLDDFVHEIRQPADKYLAVGDGFNDISMIQYAGLGVAMANAQPPVKAQADLVLPYTNDEDGVARFVSELLPQL